MTKQLQPLEVMSMSNYAWKYNIRFSSKKKKCKKKNNDYLHLSCKLGLLNHALLGRTRRGCKWCVFVLSCTSFSSHHQFDILILLQLRLMQSELSVEEVIQRRTVKVKLLIIKFIFLDSDIYCVISQLMCCSRNIHTLPTDSF